MTPAPFASPHGSPAVVHNRTNPCVLYLPPGTPVPQKAVLLNLHDVCDLLDVEFSDVLHWIEQGKLHALLTDEGLRVGLGLLPQHLEGVEELTPAEVSEMLTSYRR